MCEEPREGKSVKRSRSSLCMALAWIFAMRLMRRWRWNGRHSTGKGVESRGSVVGCEWWLRV
jgi:hypothetical protein